MGKAKKWMYVLFFSCVPILLALIMIAGAIDMTMNMIEGDKKGGSEINAETIAGLPQWITVDMVRAAVQMQTETHYPSSVVLGQMILEAGAGGSELANPPYYNCLGQKAPSHGQNGTVSMQTEEAWGTEVAEFSTFANYVDCMKAWGHKFTMDPYVKRVTACPTDPKTGHYEANAFIKAVWESGYATDSQYVQKVIGIMTSYDLYKFNSMSVGDVGMGKPSKPSKPPGSGKGRFTHPCPDMTEQTSYFGEIREFETGGHKGNDYAAPVGTTTYAADDGVVTIAGWSNSAGLWVVIDHGDGLVTKYMHHSALLVEAGYEVVRGQPIGEVGSTGQSTGPHLHFQVEVNGTAVNPDDYLE